MGFLLVIVAAGLFGTLGPLSRFAYDAGMQPAAFVAWRAFIGLIVVLAIITWRVRGIGIRLVRPADLPTRARWTLIAAAVMALTLNLSMFIAFDRITVALALLGFYTYPALVALANVALGRERLDRPRQLALGLALIGTVAVVASQLDPNAGIRFDALGFGLALGAALSQTVFVVISRDGYPQVPTEQAMGFVFTTTFLGSSVFALLTSGAGALAMPVQHPSVLPLLLGIGIFAAAIPSLLFLRGVRAIGGTRAGILMLFEPVVGVVLAAVLLAEALAPIQLVGGVAILAAALILQRSDHGDDRFAVEPGLGPAR